MFFIPYIDDVSLFEQVKLALLLILKFYGTPCIYYGTERFMEGGPDPDCRRFTNWNNVNYKAKDVYNLTKLLIRIRNNHQTLANDGDFIFIDHNELLIYQRLGEENLVIVINGNDFGVNTTLSLNEKKQYTNIINGDTIKMEVYMEPYGFMILDIK